METPILEIENTVKFVKKDIAATPEADLLLKNTTDEQVVFKIKTTDPNKYVVKPNQGVVSPKGMLVVKITTQKANMQKIKNDRFLVVGGTLATTSPAPTKQSECEDFFKTLPKDKQFTKKLKIVNDETLGMMYANYQSSQAAMASGTVNVIGEETSRASIRDTMRKTIDEEAIQKEIVELQKKRGWFNFLLYTFIVRFLCRSILVHI